ncbi:MAG: 50S ribosomal protein L32 [Saprospiraceae bacterium]|nr:50S ribosomal protein L32 [Saprospiraceae bacterium]
MAHPKSKISKQRKRKRRTHYKAEVPQISVCKETSESHQFHRAYYVGDDLYYRGKVLIKAAEEVED